MNGPVISNATPLILLARIGELALLEQVAGAIVIPVEVSRELWEYGANKPGAQILRDVSWIQVETVRNQRDVELLLLTLDRGEAEVIVLARELNARAVLIDEATARRVALSQDLPVAGTLAVLKQARDVGLIRDTRSYVARLVEAGARYRPSFLKRFLSSIGEEPL